MRNPERQRIARKKYWEQFRASHKRVYGSLTHGDYDQMSQHASEHGRSLWHQIWFESCAYRKQEYLPSEDLKKEVATLCAEIRRIGNNLNQIAYHSNRFGKVLAERHALAHLEHLEKKLQQAVLQIAAKQ